MSARRSDKEELFRLALEEAPIGIALVRLDGRFLRVNRALCEIVGYSDSELRQRTFQAITHPDDLDTDLALVDQLVRGDIPRYQLPKRYVRKDGSPVHVLLSAALARSPTGQPLYFISHVEDITERKRVENEQRILAEAGATLADSLDYEETLARVARLAVHDFADTCIIYIVEPSGELRRLEVTSHDPHLASAASRLKELPLDPRLQSLSSASLESKRPVLHAFVNDELLASFAQTEEHLEVLRTLSPRSVISVPLLVRGTLLGILVLISSQPSRIYDERDVHFADELGRRAALSIENARLYRAAQQAIKGRDDVLAIVAHDLRSPLATVGLQAQMLHIHPDDAASRRGGERIQRAVRRMERLIDDMLDVSRLDQGRLEVVPQRITASDIVHEVVESQRPIAARAGIELSVDDHTDNVEIWADRSRVIQVLENLIGNALKFTHRGGWIIVSASPRGSEIEISVADSGIGMSPEAAHHVFDRFWQERSDRRGAGLGLAIAKGITEAHHGRIWVESKLGLGTTFHFTIPTAPSVPLHEQRVG